MSEMNGRNSAYEDHVLGGEGRAATACQPPDEVWPQKVDTVSVDLGAEGRAIAAFLEILEELPAHSQLRVLQSVNDLVAPLVVDENETAANLRRLKEQFGEGEP